MRSIIVRDAAELTGSIGRMSAECAFCATALPLAEAGGYSHAALSVIHHKNGGAPAWAA